MAREIKKAVSVPVGCAGYIDPRTAPDMMNDAIANGDLDVPFVNRPLTVDPELPNKLLEGRRDEIAPCTRCFHCHGVQLGEKEKCRVNATTQYAYTEEMPEDYDMVPNMALVDEIKAAGCDAPSTIQTAIHAGYLVSRYLD